MLKERETAFSIPSLSYRLQISLILSTAKSTQSPLQHILQHLEDLFWEEGKGRVAAEAASRAAQPTACDPRFPCSLLHQAVLQFVASLAVALMQIQGDKLGGPSEEWMCITPQRKDSSALPKSLILVMFWKVSLYHFNLCVPSDKNHCPTS